MYHLDIAAVCKGQSRGCSSRIISNTSICPPNVASAVAPLSSSSQSEAPRTATLFCSASRCMRCWPRWLRLSSQKRRVPTARGARAGEVWATQSPECSQVDIHMFVIYMLLVLRGSFSGGLVVWGPNSSAHVFLAGLISVTQSFDTWLMLQRVVLKHQLGRLSVGLF